ncbi:hypothetical protein BT93_A1775 [Corymbia citriodora subsp. variegata]|nr:hypothetical protein BT93_A1775 [Corymbia citriodora subsp. variegata]
MTFFVAKKLTTLPFTRKTQCFLVAKQNDSTINRDAPAVLSFKIERSRSLGQNKASLTKPTISHDHSSPNPYSPTTTISDPKLLIERQSGCPNFDKHETGSTRNKTQKAFRRISYLTPSESKKELA